MECKRTNPNARRGFSFAEVMFAVIILGIGFIMIAALFPVAISQSKSNTDETNAAAFARAGAACFDSIATDSLMGISKLDVATNIPALQVASFPVRATKSSSSELGSDTEVSRKMWESVRGNVISSDDPRYAWIPFYFRGTDINDRKLPFAVVTMICVQSTRAPTFQREDVVPTPSGSLTASNTWANLRGRPVRIKVANGNKNNGDPDLIAFLPSGETVSPEPMYNAPNAVAEGCFVIVRTELPANSGGRLTGKIYRVGARRYDVNGQIESVCYAPGTTTPKLTPAVMVDFGSSATNSVWELIPGYDFEYIPADTGTGLPEIKAIGGGTSAGNEAWIVGRSFSDPNNNGTAFEGPAMDVSAFTTIVPCKP